MGLRRIRKQSQTADLAAQIHGSYVKGFSVPGALRTVEERYPNVSKNVIRSMTAKVYTQREALDAMLSGNMGHFVNIAKALGCGSGDVRFTTYVKFKDENTGVIKDFWQDIVVEQIDKTAKLGEFVKFLAKEALLSAREKAYKPPTLGDDVSSRLLIDSGAIRITGWECLGTTGGD